MAQIKGGLFSKGGSGSGVGFPVIEITLAQIDDNNINFTEDQFNQIMACGNFTLKLPDGTFYNFVGSNNSQQASVFFYAIKDNQTTTPTELAITQLSIVKSTYVGTISPNVYTNGGGGGSQLYQHHIHCENSRSNFINIIITNDSNSKINTTALLISYLNEKGFTTYDNWLLGNGYWNNQQCWGLWTNNNSLYYSGGTLYGGTGISPTTITDTVIEL